ncbi:16S rRNA (guanine(966)-N(2))-methyltransferase RsmD [Sulfurospirillum sp. 1307]|jgi:16S rRNA (guanine(966)-N(2))-methyltransferase RsmD
MNELSVKILAGKYKNKTIKLPSKSTTRSTKSIMKESLFNTLQFDIVNQNFVEVFGGSGSMGLEALSRGAKRAYFFEKDKQAYETLKQNCKLIAPNDTSCLYGDSFVEFPKFLKDFKSSAYFYFDPPFDIRDGMSKIYEKTLSLISMIPKEQALLIVVEHMSSKKLPSSIGAYNIKKTKKFGKSSLTYYI